MKKPWILAALAACIAGLLAFGVVRHLACARAEASIDRLQDVSFLTRALHLSEKQAAEIRSLHTALGNTLSDCCQRHCTARAQLAQALSVETNDLAQADAVVTEMCRAYEESERAALRNLRAVRAVLTLAQRTQFDRMLAECLCRQCNMPSAARKAACH